MPYPLTRTGTYRTINKLHACIIHTLTTENRCSHDSVGWAGYFFVPGEIAFLSTCRTIVATRLVLPSFTFEDDTMFITFVYIYA
jgi:hypothetical protein